MGPGTAVARFRVREERALPRCALVIGLWAILVVFAARPSTAWAEEEASPAGSGPVPSSVAAPAPPASESGTSAPEVPSQVALAQAPSSEPESGTAASAPEASSPVALGQAPSSPSESGTAASAPEAPSPVALGQAPSSPPESGTATSAPEASSPVALAQAPSSPPESGTAASSPAPSSPQGQAPPDTSAPAGSAAQPAASASPPPESEAESERPPKRPVPDYRGQEPPPPTVGEVLIWVPRVVLLPAYLVTEYVIRVPIGAVSTAAEKGNWGPAVFNFFAFGPDNKGGIFPTFLINFGFRPSIGLHFFWEDTFVTGNKVTADLAWGGSDWITIGLGDRYHFTKESSIALEGHWNRRPDNLFYGIGSLTTDDFKSRYGTDNVGGSLSYLYAGKRSRVETGARLNRTVFRDYSCCGDPTLTERVDRGELPAPPGYQENTTAAELFLRASLDTRAPDVNRSGIRVGVAVAPSVDVTRGFDRSWIHYGAGIEGSWDVTGKGRVLSLGVLAEFADPLGSEPVPFWQLVTVGGAEPFVGFLRGRLRDRSALGAQLSWRWPVFAYLDGVAGVSFGNVFDAHLRNFRWDALRLSAELGVRTAAILGASNFQFVIGIGTEPFSQGLRLTSFSLAFGVTYAL